MHSFKLNTCLRAFAGCVAALLASFDAMAALSITTSHVGGNAAKPIYTIDTNAGLVFKVTGYDTGSSTQSPGDLSSIVYNGVEYQDASRGTQINSGFDYIYANGGTTAAPILGQRGVSVTAELVDANGVATPASSANGGVVSGNDYIKITVATLAGDVNPNAILTHYYMVKNGESKIYMGTHFTAEPTGQALVRFIARLKIAALPYGSPAGTPGGLVTNADANRPASWPNDLRPPAGSTLTGIETADISGITGSANDKETRSKHYSNMRLKDWAYIGGKSDTAGAWIVRDGHEGGSGGPFYRSLLNQITATNNELTYIVNYGEGQTEAFRMNRLNAYTMVFNNGAAPASVDTSWFSKMNLLGFVGPQGRGAVAFAGISGRNAKFAYTVGFANATAQYWADAHPVDGSFTSSGMLPGDYVMTVYKNELAVKTGSVTVTANTTNSQNTIAIAADSGINPDSAARGKWHLADGDPSLTPALFRIGEWDGSPAEFLNGDKLTVMHPSDVRMANWFSNATAGHAGYPASGTYPAVAPVAANPYLVGSSSAALHMPAYQWKGLAYRNNTTCAAVPNQGHAPVSIQFKLKASQLSANGYKFRIGVTVAQAGARPQINVNGWSSGFVGSQSGDAFPPAQPSTRTITVGTYRGRSISYDYVIPASAIVAGTNTVNIWVVSGTCSTASWLTPAYAFDALDLIKQ